jgi:hypothetical protein
LGSIQVIAHPLIKGRSWRDKLTRFFSPPCAGAADMSQGVGDAAI